MKNKKTSQLKMVKEIRKPMPKPTRKHRKKTSYDRKDKSWKFPES